MPFGPLWKRKAGNLTPAQKGTAVEIVDSDGKCGFFGKTPVAQQGHPPIPGPDVNQLKTSFDALTDKLVLYGLLEAP